MVDQTRRSPERIGPQLANSKLEHPHCEIQVSEDGLLGAQAQARKQPPETTQRTAAPATDPVIRLQDEERTRCEIWTRVMGYHRPVSSWNAGKQAEHAERLYFHEPDVPR